jgi:hypothetical protein
VASVDDDDIVHRATVEEARDLPGKILSVADLEPAALGDRSEVDWWPCCPRCAQDARCISTAVLRFHQVTVPRFSLLSARTPELRDPVLENKVSYTYITHAGPTS